MLLVQSRTVPHFPVRSTMGSRLMALGIPRRRIFLLREVVVIAPALVYAGMAASADPQTYPSRSIRLIVPYPPGGGNDIVARVLGAQLSERLGRTVVVDNRIGA